MTNEELLQQAKDQVAKDAKYANWERLMECAILPEWHFDHEPAENIEALYQKAALLAIQKAREEVLKDVGEKLNAFNGYDTYRNLNDLREYIEKLTAQKP